MIASFIASAIDPHQVFQVLCYPVLSVYLIADSISPAWIESLGLKRRDIALLDKDAEANVQEANARP